MLIITWNMCVPFSLAGNKADLIRGSQGHINEVLNPRFEDFLRENCVARPEIIFILLSVVNMQQEYAWTNCWVYLHLNIAVPVGTTCFSMCAACESA